MALLSSVSITLSWATPPPLSSSDSALSTSSTSGLRPVRASGMLSPSPRRPSGAVDGGAESWTYFSPSSEVCLSSATALSGRSTFLGSRSVTRAVQPFSSIFSTEPTVTWSTLTDDCGHEVEHVGELGGDAEDVAAVRGAAGQRQVERALAARDPEEGGDDDDAGQQAAGPRHTGGLWSWSSGCSWSVHRVRSLQQAAEGRVGAAHAAPCRPRRRWSVAAVAAWHLRLRQRGQQVERQLDAELLEPGRAGPRSA